MEDKEFILEVLRRITPDTSWHGETCADDKSLDNMDILEDMIYFLLDELFIDSTVPDGNKGNGSYEAIAKRKQKVINYIKEEYFKELDERKKITLKEFWGKEEPLAIHCKTKEEANKLLNAFDKLGKRWSAGNSYINDTYWEYYGEEACYLNDGTCAKKSRCESINYKIYEFEDIDLGDE